MTRMKCSPEHEQLHFKTSVLSVKSVVCFIRINSDEI